MDSTSSPQVFEKTVEKPSKRLDAWLAENEPEHSRARWQALIKNGLVTVNGKPSKPNGRLHPGDRVEWTIPDPVSSEVLPEDIPLDILYEDPHMIVINKPAGLVVHPAAGNADGTLVNALLHHCTDLAGIGGEKRPGIVHRLDKDTSGVMVVAKTEKAMVELARQFKARETEKEYQAIVRGVPEPSTGHIETTIGRHPVLRKKMMANVKRGRHAVSDYSVMEALKNAALLRVRIETGRTHQIRVHMALIKHPVLGDRLYARPQPADAVWPDRQMLHAAKLSIAHPDSGDRLWFHAPLPPDMEALLDQLRLA
ncbi:MAG: RluA family pseudouridine synthase [Kiritimatiellales bacterium]|nr:RluA family pseudouridine synthase [Kiritimatiellota bacterium]MBL7012022.1 RluA family pseudouridine synthase [Kiritimatiellales bacterium]